MKRLLAAVMVFAGGSALAQIDATEVGPEIEEEAGEIGKSAKENVKELGEQAGAATEDQGTFKEKHAFDVSGEVKEGGRGEITLARQGLPDAVLDVRDQTKVFIDGKKADARALEEGMKADARFQLEGEETVAVRIDAKSDTAVGGAGEAGEDQQREEKAKQKKQKAEEELQQTY